MMLKWCSGICGRELPPEAFCTYRYSGKMCLVCVRYESRKARRKYYVKHAELIKAKSREAYRRNPEKYRAAARDAYHRDVEKTRARQRASYRKSGERRRAWQREYYWRKKAA